MCWGKISLQNGAPSTNFALVSYTAYVKIINQLNKAGRGCRIGTSLLREAPRQIAPKAKLVLGCHINNLVLELIRIYLEARP